MNHNFSWSKENYQDKWIWNKDFWSFKINMILFYIYKSQQMWVYVSEYIITDGWIIFIDWIAHRKKIKSYESVYTF